MIGSLSTFSQASHRLKVCHTALALAALVMGVSACRVQAAPHMTDERVCSHESPARVCLSAPANRRVIATAAGTEFLAGECVAWDEPDERGGLAVSVREDDREVASRRVRVRPGQALLLSLGADGRLKSRRLPCDRSPLAVPEVNE